jgi:VWFA-related protein
MRVGWLLVFGGFLALNSTFLLAQRTTGGRPTPSRSTGRSLGPSSPSTPNVPFPTRAPMHHADEEGRVEFRSETVLVQVPAVVTNKSGEHVRGLTRADFQVLENGKEQKIQTFEEIEPTRMLLTAPAPKSGEFSNLAATSQGRHLVTVVALDTINTPFVDQAYGRKQLVKYLAENLDPGQAISLVAITGHGLKVLHSLTSDPAASDSLAPVADFNSGASDPQGALANAESSLQDFIVHGDAAIARMQQDRAIEITMRAFLNIAASLSGISGRKSLIWATGGFPFYIDSPAAVPGGYLSVLYERAMQNLNDAEIAVYPVDVRGLMNYSPTADVTYSPRNVSGPAFARSLAARSWLQNSKIDTLRDFAEMTGGRAFYNSNDLVGSFKRATDDSSSYYLLGYYLDTKNDKPGWRQLKVKVHTSHTEVRSPNGFFVTNATANPETSKKIEIENALASPFDSTGMGLTIRWRGTSPDGDKKKIAFGVSLPPDNMTIEQGEKTHFSVEFVALALKNGVTADTVSQNIQGRPHLKRWQKLKPEG